MIVLQRTVSYILISGLLVASAALGLEDDFVVPLVPAGKGKTQNRTKTPKAAAKSKKSPEGRPTSSTAEDDLVVPLIPNEKTELAVTVPGDISGATLFVDGREMGKLPLPAFVVAPGTHSVSVRKVGYREFHKELTLLAGRYHEIVAQLVLNGGLVHVDCSMEGVELWVGNELRGTTPLAEFVLSPGTHEVIARKSGYADARYSVLVREGSQVHLAIELTPHVDTPTSPQLFPQGTRGSTLMLQPSVATSAPFYQQWYTWAAVGAVVLTAATFGIVYSNRPVTLLDPAKDVCLGEECDACIPASRCGGSP